MDQLWVKLEEPIRRFPSNSYNVFEVVNFGASCGATHGTFFDKKNMKKSKSFSTLISLHPKNIL
jgi:hypothetical protein